MLKNGKAVTAVEDAFLSAPLDDGGWDRALKEFARFTRSSRTNLVEIAPGAFVSNWVTDAPRFFHQWSEETDAGNPALNWRIASTKAPFEISSESDYREKQALIKDPIYTDYSVAVDSPFGCQTVLAEGPGYFCGLAVLRSFEDGETTEKDRARFAAAAPFVLTAIRMQRAIARQGAALAAGALEAMSAAAFICDGQGKVAALTGPAERWLQEGQARIADGWLTLADRTENTWLQRALGAVLAGENAGGASFRKWISAGTARLSGVICEIYPLPKREWSLSFQPRAVIVVREAGEPDLGRRRLLCDIFNFTPAEAEIAAMAAEGLSREQIAERRGASPGTVNSQFKSIFAKADVSREAGLVALLNKVLR